MNHHKKIINVVTITNVACIAHTHCYMSDDQNGKMKVSVIVFPE